MIKDRAVEISQIRRKLTRSLGAVGVEDREDRDVAEGDGDGDGSLVVVGASRGWGLGWFCLCLCLCSGSDSSGWVSVLGGFGEHVFEVDLAVFGELGDLKVALRTVHPEMK